jgi:hypothetical protein
VASSPATSFFDKKGDKMLLIHSPSLFFGVPAEKAVGKQFSFELYGEMEAGRPRYDSVEVKEERTVRKKEKRWRLALGNDAATRNIYEGTTFPCRRRRTTSANRRASVGLWVTWSTVTGVWRRTSCKSPYICSRVS